MLCNTRGHMGLILQRLLAWDPFCLGCCLRAALVEVLAQANSLRGFRLVPWACRSLVTAYFLGGPRLTPRPTEFLAQAYFPRGPGSGLLP